MFTPNTVIRLLENIDITIDYNNTFSFLNESSQSSFFIGKTKNVFTDFTYQRKEKTVKIGVNIETLWNVSYMMFQNSNFGTKWFYAFITDMKYINDDVTEISFEIDVLQTWYFDIDIKDSFIEREHVEDDSLFLYSVEENLNVGEIITRSFSQTDDINELVYVVASTKQYDELPPLPPPKRIIDAVGREFANVYSGLAYIGFDNVLDLNLFIFNADVGGYGDSVQNIFVMPKNLITSFINDWNITSPNPVKLSYSHPKNFTDIDGYFPKNNKLFNYPYNFLYVSAQGQTAVYKYEFTSDSNLNFEITSNLQPNPTVFLSPKNYKGVAINYDETLTLSNYPLCNWVNDIYRNWLAQNVVSNPLSVISSTLALGVGVATANPIAIAGGAIGVANTIGGFIEKSIQPNQSRGSQSGGANVSAEIQTFNVYAKTITAKYARIIDNYFDKYGYKINEIKTPNLLSRANWNYVKMIEANIFGNIPNKDLKKIHEIYNKGLTFWHNDNVGDYDRNNPII